MKKQLLAIACGLFLSLIFIIFSIEITHPKGQPLQGIWMVENDNSALDISGAKSIFQETRKAVGFVSHFSGTNHQVLMILSSSDTTFRVSINGQELTKWTHRSRLRHRLPNALFTIIPEGLLDEENTMIITFSNLPSESRHFLSSFSMTMQEYIPFDRNCLLFDSYFTAFSFGSLVLLSFILFSMGWYGIGVKKKAYLLMGTGIFVSCIGLFPLFVETAFISLDQFTEISLMGILVLFFCTYLGLVMFMKSIGIFFFDPPRFSNRLLWGIPLITFIFLLEHFLPRGLLLLIVDLGLIVLLVCFAYAYYLLRSKMTAVVFFMLGCSIFSLLIVDRFSQSIPNAPYLRDHGIFAFIFMHGFLLVKDYRSLFREKNSLLEKSTKDGLTGLFNQTSFKTILTNHIRMPSQNHPSFLLLFDIDDYKKLNDTYGHVAGDAILKEVAKRTQERIRSTDAIGRYGGDEFGILLLNTNEKQARWIGEKIRKAVSEKPFTVEGETHYVTVSIGISPIQSNHTHAEEWIREADKALYRSKKAGKNRLSV